MGSITNPIPAPTRSNLEVGNRVIFNMSLRRCEPKPNSGTYTEEANINFNDLRSIPDIKSSIWSKVGNRTTSETISNFLSVYSTQIRLSDSTIEQQYWPFLENIYAVKPNYYTQEFIIKIEVSINISYTIDDVGLYRSITTHSYTIYLKKQSERSSNEVVDSVNIIH